MSHGKIVTFEMHLRMVWWGRSLAGGVNAHNNWNSKFRNTTRLIQLPFGDE